MSVGAKDILIRELKDSLNEQRELNKTLRSALNISNIQVQELTVQVKLLNEQIDYMKRNSHNPPPKYSRSKKVEYLTFLTNCL